MHTDVLCDILIIIIANKIIVQYLPVNSKGNQYKKQAYRYITVFEGKLFVTIVYSGHGITAGNEDGILWMNIIILIILLNIAKTSHCIVSV